TRDVRMPDNSGPTWFHSKQTVPASRTKSCLLDAKSQVGEIAMDDEFRRPEQQHEGQEHQFLEYEQAYIYFIYSFSWDISITWEGLKEDLLRDPNDRVVVNGSLSAKGWRLRRLHERVLWDSG